MPKSIENENRNCGCLNNSNNMNNVMPLNNMQDPNFNGDFYSSRMWKFRPYRC